ncbi:mitochondrial carrier domain-containing protein [Echria macrotheca]|uniref:Mitochondrial carrier domain-containing protein n=1 Tax=Echria macrotheca TaxID=438768 RepID=A0AAJ0BJK1_9PEZI|nr:mitochondrial carrier domain-containing protein [Echria macrotheca]
MMDSKHTEVVLAGAVAAFTVDLLVYPLDTIKTRYQSQQYINRSGAASTYRSLYKGLYQGIGSVVIATLPAAGVFFVSYEAAKSGLAAVLPSAIPQPAVHALASGAAELASCAVLTPAEVIKQNAQVLRESGNQGRESTSLRALRMLRSDGRVGRRLWSGYTALAARNLPFTAMHFPMFEFLRARLWEQRDRRRGRNAALLAGSGPISEGRLQAEMRPNEARSDALRGALIEVGAITGAAAATSGSIAALLTTPTDVVKTRMMLAAGGGSASGSASPARRGAGNAFETAKIIFRENGTRGLFRGGALRMAWTALGSGLYLGSYEMAKFWLRRDSFEPGNVTEPGGRDRPPT